MKCISNYMYHIIETENPIDLYQQSAFHWGNIASRNRISSPSVFLSIYSLPYKNMYACHYIYMSGKSVQFSSVAQLCPTFCNPMDCSMPGFPVHQQLLDLTQTHVHPVPLCCPILLPSSVFPRNRIFFNQSALHIKWPKYWNFNFNISPSNEYSGLIYQD